MEKLKGGMKFNEVAATYSEDKARLVDFQVWLQLTCFLGVKSLHITGILSLKFKLELVN
jgi:hypothetical protein